MRTIVLAVVFGALNALPAVAQPTCDRYAQVMQPGMLYQLKCVQVRGRETCNVHLVTPNFNVRTGSTSRFFYKTALSASAVQNSLVVVQLKFVGTQPQAKPADVTLARKRIDFACQAGESALVGREATPTDPDNIETAQQKIPYASYDAYHRKYRTPSSDARALDDFHVHYNNGQQCVRTTDDGRREQFLFERHNETPHVISRLWGRFNLPEPTTTVYAAELLRYEQLHVLLHNYKKKPSEAGCIAFSIPGKGMAVGISLSDIEANVLARQVVPTATWTLNVH